MNYIKLNGQEIHPEKVTQFTDAHDLATIEIQLQNGAIKENGVNGCQIDDVIELTKNIIQSFNNRFPCRENSMIITKLDEALLWSLKRKLDREKRGVEGTSEK